MRIETGQIVAGQYGTEIYRLRPFSTPRFESRLASSDSALAHYRVFAENHVPGNVWGMVGGLSLGFSLAASADVNWAPRELVIGTAVFGAISILIGSNKSRKARNSLARAIWWYNRDLPR